MYHYTQSRNVEELSLLSSHVLAVTVFVEEAYEW